MVFRELTADDKEVLKILPDKIYIAFYLDGDGSKSRGEWKESEERIDEEIKRYRRAHYRWVETSFITKDKIIDMARELNMDIRKILKNI